MVTNLTKKEIEKIQIDESLIFLDFGESTEKFLAPTRGGGEFVASVTVRDIDFDGKRGKVAGMQTIDEQFASIKVTTICMSQENLALAIPGCAVETTDGKTIMNPASGIIPESAYLKNVTMFAKLIGGAFKKITIYNPMHESGMTAKAVQKAEGELGLELHAHYPYSDLNKKGGLWKIEEITEAPKIPADETAAAQTAAAENTPSNSEADTENN